MKKVLLLLVLALAGVAGLVLAYREMRKERDLEASAETPVIAPSRVEGGADGAPVLKLDAETQQRLGLQTARPVAGSVTPELTATARVLDGATLASLVQELRSARAGWEAARADHERKKQLFDNGRNASASAVEQAGALVTQQQLAVEAARDRITATWGREIATHQDLPAFARSLLQREDALVRVELLATDQLATVPESLRLWRSSGEAIATARLLGPAPATDSALAGKSFLCLVTGNAATLVPGATLIARLDQGAPESGTVLPRRAVLRHAGLGWAYVQLSADTFARQVVPLDRPHPEGWLVRGEWKQPVVIAGAQSLLSEELKGRIQMKD